MNFNYSMGEDLQLYKYSEYVIKEIEERKYIFPADNAQIQESNINEKVADLLIELLDIGKSVYFNETDIEGQVMDFVSKYGLFGFINYFPVNELYFLDNEIVLKEDKMIDEYLIKADVVSYIRIFMPNLLNQDIVDKIVTAKENIKANRITENSKMLINMNFAYSHDYGEPIEMITKYVKQLYEDLMKIQNEDTNDLNVKDFVTLFESKNGKELALKYETLKNAMDAVFVSEVMAEVRKLKICRYCDKPFIAVNPKAEYDTPACKNKANVYKFRSKEK